MLYIFSPKAWQISVVQTGTQVWTVWLTLAVNGLSKIPRPNTIGIAAQIPFLDSGVKAEMCIANVQL